MSITVLIPQHLLQMCPLPLPCKGYFLDQMASPMPIEK